MSRPAPSTFLSPDQPQRHVDESSTMAGCQVHSSTSIRIRFSCGSLASGMTMPARTPLVR
jgi:hypothetical protein